jgi:hypothetical protein
MEKGYMVVALIISETHIGVARVPPDDIES